MVKRIKFLLFFLCLFSSLTKAQNFSNLLNKRLVRMESLGTAVESLLGGIGGGLSGNIDSVVVINDAETRLGLRVYFTGYQDAFFSVSTMNDARQKDPAVNAVKNAPAAIGSPIEFLLKLDPAQAPSPEFQSQYLRIDISKSENRPGKVKIFELRKNWRSGTSAPKMFVRTSLQPIGVAAQLKQYPSDIVPAKKIKFDPKAAFTRPDIKSSIRTSGGNFFRPRFRLFYEQPYFDLNGDWRNSATAPASRITRLVVTNGTTMRPYQTCGNTECDMGSSNILPAGTDNWTARVFFENREGTLKLRALSANQLEVKHVTKMPFSTKTITYTFNRQINLTVVDWGLIDWGKKPTTPVSTVAEGPAYSKQINLWNDIAVDPAVDFQRPQDISNININLYGDKNPYSGVYYILPADYHLRWEAREMPEQGYNFTMLYGKQEGGTEMPDAPVRISATLTPGISQRERNLVKAILGTVDGNFKEVKFLPLKDVIQTNFPATLNAQFGIPVERITVNTSSDLTNDMTLAFRTNPDTKEFIQTALMSREGLSATVTLKPKNEEIPELQIPAIINLADTRSLGKMLLEPLNWRTRGWKNPTPYPLQVRYLHVMKKANNGNALLVYSWSIDNIVVPSKGQVEFDHSRVPGWLDHDPTSVFWLDYAVMDCGECDNKVLAEVTGGVFGATTQNIRFTIPPAVFDTLNAEYFLVTIRSKQGDPKNETVKELPGLKILRDASKEYVAGPLYLTPGVTPDFEYTVVVATRDGEFYRTGSWMKATERDILLGKKEIKDMFRGIVPGIN